jgi:hypothetical protein
MKETREDSNFYYVDRLKEKKLTAWEDRFIQNVETRKVISVDQLTVLKGMMQKYYGPKH